MSTPSYIELKNKFEKLIVQKNIRLTNAEKAFKDNNNSDIKVIQNLKKEITNAKCTITRPTTAFNYIPETTEINPINIWNLINTNPNWKTENSRIDNYKRVTEILKFGESDPSIIQKIWDRENMNPEAKKVDLTAYIAADLTYQPYYNFIRNLYTNYPCLRGDYYSVKLNKFDETKDNYYKEGKIIFNTLMKNQGNKIVELNDSDIYFIESWRDTNDYIFDGNNLEFCEMIRNIEGRGVNFYRHLCAQKFAERLGINKESLNELYKHANDMNTSVDMFKSNYLNNV